jgi:selenocysteine lyase/cysteine desulfurase
MQNQSSRRQWLQTLSKTATAAATWGAMAEALRGASPKGTSDDEDYWKLVKRQFPLEQGLLYFNAANVCPASRAVLDRHAEFLRDFEANPSFQNRLKYEGLRSGTRAKIAAVLRVKPQEITITRNTSEGSNLLVHGLNLKAGDEVIVFDHNHPSNLDSWRIRASREGFTLKILPVRVPAKSKQELIDLTASAINSKTRVIGVTHLTSTTGVLFPAKEIAAMARQRGIWMHLDGAQTFGALDVDLSSIGPDSYTASAHKWLMGPLEAGILYIRAERSSEVWPSVVSAGWKDELRNGERLEVFGQRDDPRLVALDSAIDFIQLIGMSNIEARVRRLSTLMKSEMSRIPNVRVKTNMEPELSGGVIKAMVGTGAQKASYDALWDKHRIATSLTPSGDSAGIRFSPHIYNTTDEVMRVVEAVRGVAAA